MANYIFTSSTNYVTLRNDSTSQQIDKNSVIFTRFENDDRKLFISKRSDTNLLAIRKPKGLLLDLDEDNINVDGVTSFVNAQALSDVLASIFFLVNGSGGGGTPTTQTLSFVYPSLTLSDGGGSIDTRDFLEADNTLGGIKVLDATTPLTGQSVFSVESNDSTEVYFDVKRDSTSVPNLKVDGRILDQDVTVAITGSDGAGGISDEAVIGIRTGATSLGIGSDLITPELQINLITGEISTQTANYESLVVNDSSIPNKKYVDDLVNSGTNWSNLSVVNNTDSISAGLYKTDASGGNFSITLNGVVGEYWWFADTNSTVTITTNEVTIGTVGDTFTDETGTYVAGPFIIDSPATSVIIFKTGANAYDILNVSGVTANLNNYQLLSEKGLANGYASLDNTGVVPLTQLPFSTPLVYQGTYDATLNNPSLVDGTGTLGHVYLVENSGSNSEVRDLGSGVQSFTNQDLVIYNGSVWQVSSNVVTSIFQYLTGTLPTSKTSQDLVLYSRLASIRQTTGAGTNSYSEIYNLNNYTIAKNAEIETITVTGAKTPTWSLYDWLSLASTVNTNPTYTINNPVTSGLQAGDTKYISLNITNGVDAEVTLSFGSQYVNIDGSPLGSRTVNELNSIRYLKFVYDNVGLWVLTESNHPSFGSGAIDNFVTADLTSTANRLHTFNNVLQIIGTGQKSITSSDGAGRTAYVNANQGLADVYVSNSTGANSSITGLRILNSNGVSASASLTTTDPVTGITSAITSLGDELRIITPEVDAGNAVVDQILKLDNINGSAEWKNLKFTQTFVTGDWVSDGISQTSISVTAATHQIGLNPNVKIYEVVGTTATEVDTSNIVTYDTSTGDVTITILEGEEFNGVIHIM